jgi:tripartite-type tricarboxylate transporter receptor subunit TctC
MKTIDRVARPVRSCLQRMGDAVGRAIVVLSMLLGGSFAHADSAYPSRPITMIIPFPAGGPADIVGRLYAKQLSDLLGQTVITQNRDGAGSIIGTGIVARAVPDGYTILFGTTSTMAVNQVIMTHLPYDFSRDFSLIGLIANAPHILAVRDGLPAKTAGELIALAKKNPGKYTIASSGVGTIVQMAGALFTHEAGLNILDVPYKGGGPATVALLTGDVDMTVNDLTTLKGNLASGKLRALGVAWTHRLALYPDVPTFTELGLPKIVSSTWWGVAVPAKTPTDIQARLREANSKIIVDPDYVSRLAALAVEPLVLTPEQTVAFIRDEVLKWKAVATAANIHLD